MISRRQLLARSAAGTAAALLAPAVFGRPATVPSTTSSTAPAFKPIPTATGDISPAQLGIASLHEHIAVRPNSDPAQREQGLALAVRELKRAKALGLASIIDVGPSDDVPAVREASLASGVQVVCCTGFYTLLPAQQAMTVEEFEAKMLRDFEHGLQGTDVRPGVIKVATRALPIKPAENNLLVAAARVQQKYRIPICTHAVTGCVEQQEILEAAGADLAHCYFSHTEATFGWSGRDVPAQIDYLETLVRKGSTLCFNNFGNWNHTKPEALARILTELVRRGYDDRIVATMDLTWNFKDGKLVILWEDTNEAGRDRTYGYLLDTAVPWMVQAGVPRASVDKFVLDNPRRIFSFPA